MNSVINSGNDYLYSCTFYFSPSSTRGGGVETTPSTNGFSSVTFARGRKSKIKFGLKSFNDDQIGEYDKI